MNRTLGHFCAHTGYIGPGEPSEDGEMTLPPPPPDTRFEIQTLEVTEAPHNTEFYEWMGRNIFSFQTTEIEKRTPNSSVKGSGTNHYPRARALLLFV